MPVYRPLGEEIVTETEYISRFRFEPRTGQGKSFAAGRADGTGEFKNFEPLDFGKALNVVLRRIYTGRYPEKHVFSNKKPMLVSSAVRDISTTSAGARALNVLKHAVSPQSVFSGPDAAEEGTNLIYYSPAMASPFLTVSLTMIFEEFDQELFDRASKLFGNLAGVPIFMPALGYLLGASTLLKLAGNAGSQMLNGYPALNENLQLDFAFGGGAVPKSGYWVLSSQALDLRKYSFDPDKGLIQISNSAVYDGPDPVIVISIDGREVSGLANFAPLLASTTLLSQFFNQKDGSEVAMDSIFEAAKLLNDLSYRKKAEEVQMKLSTLAADSPDRKKLSGEMQAFNGNISEARLRLSIS
jgi:hypothetical protein